MKTTYLLAVAFAMAATPALACTAEEATAKATELSTKLQELAASDPQKAGELAQKLTEGQTQVATNLEGACEYYDNILAEIE